MDKEKVNKLYTECANIVQQYCDETMLHWVKQYAEVHSTRLIEDFQMLSNLKTQSSILEIGSAPPVLTLMLKKSGFNIVGVDIDASRFKTFYDEYSITVISCNIELEKLTIPNYTEFDCIIFNEVFEHLRINIPWTMESVLNNLKSGGKFFLSTPNLRSATGLYNFLFKNRAQSINTGIQEQYSKLESIGHMGHVREYTTHEVRELLSSLGLKNTGVIYRGSYNNHWDLLFLISKKLRPFVTQVFIKI